ncbi:dihydropteroate synthase [Asticcacaulis sp. AC402]|uniref:dihydropteroate synthase n=1 Tax=Asticcacaulis sp. AC402 TaxID=1282361 RepID=UPI0003C3F649|nr:dihydropteroate synthase [Asticcacaulis sp. AC402]ESQ77597.1 dihydropteroate synthase [Asticcacaulis sp. AC402]
MLLLDLYAARGPLIMGVVNVTPDSFSDGGRHFGLEAGLEHAQQLIRDGADVLDIGGESTRPGAAPVTLEEEINRVVPLISALSSLTDIALSIDTFKPEVAEEAFKAGAQIWNDVSALSYSSESLEIAAKLNGDIVLMHMKGEPRTMQSNPWYEDVVGEVESYLLERAGAAIRAGVSKSRIWLDPGIGFGKNLDHNLDLIRATRRLSGNDFPLVMAASRKRFIAALEEREGAEPSQPDDRIGATVAVHLHAVAEGAKMVRVHDVAEMKQAMRLWRAISGAG